MFKHSRFSPNNYYIVYPNIKKVVVILILTQFYTKIPIGFDYLALI